jgi:carboxymethylenebutenolidase
VVMIHEFWGLNEALLSKADLLAADGYLVVAPDTLRGATTRWLPKALWHTLSTPDERVIEDLDTVIAWLRSRDDVDAERIVVMGFCYGGGKALAYALARPDVPAGTAVFYGDLSDDAAALARLEGPVLGVFGRDDTLVTPAEVDAFERALRQAGVDHVLLRFDDVGHAFVTSADGIATDPTQAAAWGAWTAWLREVTAGRGGTDER